MQKHPQIAFSLKDVLSSDKNNDNEDIKSSLSFDSSSEIYNIEMNMEVSHINNFVKEVNIVTRIKSVSQFITKIGNIKISLVVMFPLDKPVLNRSVYNGESSINYDIVSFIKIDVLYEAERRIDPIILTQYYKHVFIQSLKKMCMLLQKKDIFYIDKETDEMKIYSNNDEEGKSRWLIKSQVGKNVIALHPVVVYPYVNSTGIEGIRIMINSSDTFIDISYEDAIILIEILKDINIPILSNLLIRSLSSKSNINVDDKRIDVTKSKLDMLDETSTFNKRMEMMSEIKGSDSSTAIGKAAKDFRDIIERRILNGKNSQETSNLSGNEND